MSGYFPWGIAGPMDQGLARQRLRKDKYAIPA